MTYQDILNKYRDSTEFVPTQPSPQDALIGVQVYGNDGRTSGQVICRGWDYQGRWGLVFVAIDGGDHQVWDTESFMLNWHTAEAEGEAQ